MEFYSTIPVKIALIVSSGFLGTTAGTMGSDVGVVGGWGFAVTVTYFLWKQLNEERDVARKDREAHYEQLREERIASDRRHNAAVDFTRECTMELRRLRESMEEEIKINSGGSPRRNSLDEIHIKPISRDVEKD